MSYSMHIPNNLSTSFSVRIPLFWASGSNSGQPIAVADLPDHTEITAEYWPNGDSSSAVSIPLNSTAPGMTGHVENDGDGALVIWLASAAVQSPGDSPIFTVAISPTASWVGEDFQTLEPGNLTSFLFVGKQNIVDANGRVDISLIEGTDATDAIASSVNSLGLSTFDHTSDQVVASNMRGTDNAMLASSYTAPDNASITAILADTNELQQNQVDVSGLLTTASFNAALPTNFTSLSIDGSGVVDANATVDTSGLLTETTFNAALPQYFDQLLIEDGTGKVTTANPAAGSGSAHTAQDVANLILETPANKLKTDVNGRVDVSLIEGSDATNTIGSQVTSSVSALNLSTFDHTTDQVTAGNMRGTDNALLNSNYTAPNNSAISQILADTDELQQNQNNWATADLSGLLTTTAFNSALPTNFGSMSISGGGQVAANTDLSGVESSLSQILADTDELQQNQSNWLTADVSGLLTTTSYNSSLPTNFDSLAIDGSGNVNMASGGISASDVYDYFTTSSREDAFKATEVTVSDKTGFKLASDGLDTIAVGDPASGDPTTWTFPQKIGMLVARFFNKVTHDTNSGSAQVFASDDMTVLSQQSWSTSSGIETQSKGS